MVCFPTEMTLEKNSTELSFRLLHGTHKRHYKWPNSSAAERRDDCFRAQILRSI